MPIQDPTLPLSPARIILKRALTVSVLAGIAVWICFSLQDRFQMARRINQAKDIFLVSRFYAKDHGGRMPGTFDQLSPWAGPNYGEAVAIVVQRERGKFEFVSKNLTDTSNPSSILVRERSPDSRGWRVIGHADGSAVAVHENP